MCRWSPHPEPFRNPPNITVEPTEGGLPRHLRLTHSCLHLTLTDTVNVLSFGRGSGCPTVDSPSGRIPYHLYTLFLAEL